MLRFAKKSHRMGWVAALALGTMLAAGVPAHAAADPDRAAAVQGILNTDEYRAKLAQMHYHKLLGRAATATEVSSFGTAWQGADGWKTAIASIAATPAYYQRAGSSNAGLVNRLFQDFAGRTPDAAAELPPNKTFLDQGGDRAQLAQIIMTSDEGQGVLVRFYYQTLLHRAATPAQATALVTKLAAGGPDAVIVEIVASPEYYAAHGGTVDSWTASAQNDLVGGAAPAPNPVPNPVPVNDPGNGGNPGGMGDPGGMGNPGNMGGNAGDPGNMGGNPGNVGNPMPAESNARTPMVQAMITSPEFQKSVVQGYYRKFLGRAATAAEESAWIGTLQGGGSSEQVLMGVLTSDEYYNRAGGNTSAFLQHLSRDLLGTTGSNNNSGGNNNHNNNNNNNPSVGDVLDVLRGLPHHH